MLGRGFDPDRAATPQTSDRLRIFVLTANARHVHRSSSPGGPLGHDIAPRSGGVVVTLGREREGELRGEGDTRGEGTGGGEEVDPGGAEEGHGEGEPGAARKEGDGKRKGELDGGMVNGGIAWMGLARAPTTRRGSEGNGGKDNAENRRG